MGAQFIPTDFKDLDDTPSTYTGQSGKVATVKATEDGLEFTAAGGSVAVQVDDVEVTATASVLDFDGDHFTVTDNPAGEANISAHREYNYLDQASKESFNPHILAGYNGYRKSASNPIIDDTDGATITGVALATIQAGQGEQQAVVIEDAGWFYLFLDIDISGGVGNQNRPCYLIKSTDPFFTSYQVVGQIINTAVPYERLVAPQSVVKDFGASGTGSDTTWKMDFVGWGSGGFGTYTAYATNIEGPWAVNGTALIAAGGCGSGGGFSAVGNELIWYYINSGAAPYVINRRTGTLANYSDPNYYVGSLIGMDVAEAGTTTTNIKMTGHGLAIGDIIENVTRSGVRRAVTAVPDANNVTVASVTGQTTSDVIKKFTDLEVVTPALSGDYNNGFRFFSIFKHADGLYLVARNENTAADLHHAAVYLLKAGNFAAGALTVHPVGPVVVKGANASDWDANGCFSPYIICHNRETILYYTSGNATSGNYIGIATLHGSI